MNPVIPEVAKSVDSVMRPPAKNAFVPDDISSQIVVLRGRKVLMDANLAQLYAVTTKRLNEQVRRNRRRFPSDFVFRLPDHEFTNLRSQFATSSLNNVAWGGRRYLPYREALAAHEDLAVKLAELERKTEALGSKHDALAAETHAQFREVIEALRQLMSAPAPRRRPIGFVTSK